MGKVNFVVVERTDEQVLEEFEKVYQEFKRIWVDDPFISKTKAYRLIGKSFKSQSNLSLYINDRLRQDNLPLTHDQGGMITAERIQKTPAEAYEAYKKLFFTTTLTIPRIFKELDLSRSNTLYYKYIMKHSKLDGLNGFERYWKIKRGEWI